MTGRPKVGNWMTDEQTLAEPPNDHSTAPLAGDHAVGEHRMTRGCFSDYINSNHPIDGKGVPPSGNFQNRRIMRTTKSG